MSTTEYAAALEAQLLIIVSAINELRELRNSFTNLYALASSNNFDLYSLRNQAEQIETLYEMLVVDFVESVDTDEIVSLINRQQQ